MCGIAGAIGVENASSVVRTMLHRLQHRGQEAVGIVSIHENKAHKLHVLGKTVISISDTELANLPGNIAVGHNRYATTGNSRQVESIQPFVMTLEKSPMVMAHNGNFTNITNLEATELSGTPFSSDSDTERFFRLMMREERSGNAVEDNIIATLQKMKGSCSALHAQPGHLIAIRDSTGNRPLYWALYKEGFVVASETCAFQALGIQAFHEVPIGTIVTMHLNGQAALKKFGRDDPHKCFFEPTYLASPGSEVYGIDVAEFRVACGQALALEHPVHNADYIVGIPDSSSVYATGYAEKNTAGRLRSYTIMRNHSTRSFIEGDKASQLRTVDRKFTFHPASIKGKVLVLIDDSIVRGTTSQALTESLRAFGAKEIHWRIGSPPVTGPCHYGIATKTGELLATKMDNQEMAKFIGADSLEFLSMAGLKKVIAEQGASPKDFCFACIDGKYWDLT